MFAALRCPLRYACATVELGNAGEWQVSLYAVGAGQWAWRGHCGDVELQGDESIGAHVTQSQAGAGFQRSGVVFGLP